METTYLAATTPRADQTDCIVVVSDLGHDDQDDYSDIAFCAVRIERAALAKLREIITFAAESYKAFHGGIKSIDFQLPEGVDIAFFNLRVDNADPDADYTARMRMVAKLARLFERKDSPETFWRGRQTIVRRRAQEVWDFAEEGESELEWRLDAKSINVWAK